MNWFGKAATAVSDAMGSPVAFALAATHVAVWAMLGPYFGWSDSHSLFINTDTTIQTYLTVFLIQYTQNRDTRQIKTMLQELILAQKGARNRVVNLDELDDGEIAKLAQDIKDRAKRGESRDT